ncbi:MAG TPA: hypothetical protein VFC78_22180 [Tepidisphaeraceae bacterium]|nr:hypothetical protein [Tepidisphaeraceae bacterium]
MAAIYHIAYDSDGPPGDRLKNDAEYPICLGYAALVVRELLLAVDPRLVLQGGDEVGVAVGFDSGDFVSLGKVTNQGLLLIGNG